MVRVRPRDALHLRAHRAARCPRTGPRAGACSSTASTPGPPPPGSGRSPAARIEGSTGVHDALGLLDAGHLPGARSVAHVLGSARGRRRRGGDRRDRPGRRGAGGRAPARRYRARGGAAAALRTAPGRTAARAADALAMLDGADIARRSASASRRATVSCVRVHADYVRRRATDVASGWAAGSTAVHSVQSSCGVNSSHVLTCNFWCVLVVAQCHVRGRPPRRLSPAPRCSARSRVSLPPRGHRFLRVIASRPVRRRRPRVLPRSLPLRPETTEAASPSRRRPPRCASSGSVELISP